MDENAHLLDQSDHDGQSTEPDNLALQSENLALPSESLQTPLSPENPTNKPCISTQVKQLEDLPSDSIQRPVRLEIKPDTIAQKQQAKDLRKAKKAARDAKWAAYRAERNADPKVRALWKRKIKRELAKADPNMSAADANAIAEKALKDGTQGDVISHEKTRRLTAGRFRLAKRLFFKRVKRSEKRRSAQLTEALAAVEAAELAFHGERRPTSAQLEALKINYVAECRRLRRLFLKISRARIKDETKARKNFGVTMLLAQGAIRTDRHGVQLRQFGANPIQPILPDDPVTKSNTFRQPRDENGTQVLPIMRDDLIRPGERIIPGGPVFRPPDDE